MARGIKTARGAKRRAAADSDDEAPVVKKAKATAGTALGKKKVDLSMFQGLPLDLLPEIFQHLSPSDLVNLCDASLSFYNALCRNSATSLWKTCRENEGIYEIPDGMNEYYWAQLLFSSRCMECGAENVRLADFYLRRRICKQCKKNKCITRNYESESKFSKLAFDCSPETHITWSGSTSSLNQVYWTADVVTQHKKLKALKLDVEMDRLGATRALEEYKVSRRKLLRVIRAEVPDFEKYQSKQLEKQKEEKEDLFAPRYDEVKRRFVELGYIAKDFPPNMKMHKQVRSKANLTDRAWKGILETLEPEIQVRRDNRIKIEWVNLRAARRHTLDKAYAAHKFKNVAHPLWISLPQVHVLCTLGPFDDLIICDKERTLTPEDFAGPFSQLDEILGAAYEEARVRLRNRVIEAKDPFLSQLESTEGFESLELATIVFRCKHCQRLIFGFDDIKTHKCKDWNYALSFSTRYREDPAEPKRLSHEFPFDCTFEPGAAEVMCMVVELFGLDPKTATTAQMDEKELRLKCACDATESRPMVYTWADFFYHLRISARHQKELATKDVRRPEIYPDSSMAIIRTLESNLRREKSAPFACAHCAEYGTAGNLGWQDTMVRHAREQHGIQDPLIGVDLVDLKGQRAITRDNFTPGLRYEK